MVKNDICLGDASKENALFSRYVSKKRTNFCLLISEVKFWSIRIGFILPLSPLNLGISFNFGKFSSNSIIFCHSCCERKH